MIFILFDLIYPSPCNEINYYVVVKLFGPPSVPNMSKKMCNLFTVIHYGQFWLFHFISF